MSIIIEDAFVDKDKDKVGDMEEDKVADKAEEDNTEAGSMVVADMD